MLVEIEDHFAKYRISEALMTIYKLVWDDFCSWLLEIVKPAYQQPIDRKSYTAIISIFENNLKLLHPFMPFLSEEIWQRISERKPSEALVIATWPEMESYDPEQIKAFDLAAEVISGIRNIRKEKNIPLKETLELSVLNKEGISEDWDVVIKKLANVEPISTVLTAVDGALSFRVRSNEYFIPVSGMLDIEAEIKKIREELSYTKGFLQSVTKKLANDRFVKNAPEKVVTMEKKKAADAKAKIENLKKVLAISSNKIDVFL